MTMTTQLVQKYCTIPILCHHIIIFGYVVFKMILSKKKTLLTIEWILLLCLFMNMLLIISSFALFFPCIESSQFCRSITCANLILNPCSKLLMYYFFGERLFIVFNQKSLSLFQFTSYQIKLIRILFLFFTLIICTLLLTDTITSHKLDTIQYNHQTQSCIIEDINMFNKTALFPVLVTLILVSDSLICSTLTILSVRRLLQLSVIVRSKNQKHPEQICQSHNVLKKCILLSIIAVVTTQISLFTAMITLFAKIFILLLMIIIDSTVNIWCMLLTFKAYKPIYNILCGTLNKRITHQCLLCFSCNCLCKLQSIGIVNNGNRDKQVDLSINVNKNQRPGHSEIIQMTPSPNNDLSNHHSTSKSALAMTAASKPNKNDIDSYTNGDMSIGSYLMKPMQDKLFKIYQKSPEECIKECKKLQLDGEDLQLVIEYFQTQSFTEHTVHE